MTTNPSEQKKPPRFVTLCGRIFHNIDATYFPRLEYRGRPIYLCTEACCEAFRADPDVFHKAHRSPKEGKGLTKPE